MPMVSDVEMFTNFDTQTEAGAIGILLAQP